MKQQMRMETLEETLTRRQAGIFFFKCPKKANCVAMMVIMTCGGKDVCLFLSICISTVWKLLICPNLNKISARGKEDT